MDKVTLDLNTLPQVVRIEINSAQQPYVVTVYWQTQYYTTDGRLFNAIDHYPITKLMDAETLGKYQGLMGLLKGISDMSIVWMNEAPAE